MPAFCVAVAKPWCRRPLLSAGRVVCANSGSCVVAAEIHRRPPRKLRVTFCRPKAKKCGYSRWHTAGENPPQRVVGAHKTVWFYRKAEAMVVERERNSRAVAVTGCASKMENLSRAQRKEAESQDRRWRDTPTPQRGGGGGG